MFRLQEISYAIVPIASYLDITDVLRFKSVNTQIYNQLQPNTTYKKKMLRDKAEKLILKRASQAADVYNAVVYDKSLDLQGIAFAGATRSISESKLTPQALDQLETPHPIAGDRVCSYIGLGIGIILTGTAAYIVKYTNDHGSTSPWLVLLGAGSLIIGSSMNIVFAYSLYNTCIARRAQRNVRSGISFFRSVSTDPAAIEMADLNSELKEVLISPQPQP